MKIRFPLYAKILFWFFLNVVFLCAVFLVAARGQFHFGLDTLISGPAGDRLQTVTQVITEELRDRPQQEWNGVLQRFSDAYHVQFYLFHNEDMLAGTPVELPSEVRARMMERRGMNPTPHPEMGRPTEGFGPPPREGVRGPGQMGRPLQKLMVHTSSPSRYWVIERLLMPGPEQPPRPMPVMLLAASESLSAGGLFFDLTSWAVAGVAVVLVSVLFWFPLVRGITRSISRMTRATEQIAEGRFEVRTQVRRQDELGSLSEAINRMAERLSGFVAGQKRFLGDIAHELCSPIARIQVALGILEQRADEKQKEYLADLREEVEQMSNLVNELLSFSKASLGAAKVKLQPVPVRALVEKAAGRECGNGREGMEMKIEVAEDVGVLADPELLLRAVGNILRNALHHAGQAGPVTISAAQTGGHVEIIIEDCGPGIPKEAIARVFDPFYRVDASRARETGGVGLGLSIVKTCIESCGGTVRCENREPRGLRVIMRLAGASQSL
ncbi:MAG: Integral rane sensor signal transduction histidine kinase [Pedosphaera sp.]|nr:Integral rane sensor signal transduction histidine kinase [Pedosphaera sp.]